MTVQDPGGGAPGHRDDAPSIPDSVWQQFLDDHEAAIQESALKEPSSKERKSWGRLSPLNSDSAEQQTDPQWNARRDGEWDSSQAVGELWQPEDPWSGLAWRDMDSRARRHRIGRTVGVVAALIIVLGAASHLSTGSVGDYREHGDATSQQSEDAPDELTTLTGRPSAPSSAGE